MSLLIVNTKRKNSQIYFTNECNHSLVNRLLENGEKIIGKFLEFNYKADKKSILGAKHAYITNLGQIITYDEGGIFADKLSCVFTDIKYDFRTYSCDFNLSSSAKVLLNNGSTNFIDVNAIISVDDYLRLSSEIMDFVIDYESLSSPIVDFDDSYFSVKIKFDSRNIIITNITNKYLYTVNFEDEEDEEDIKIELRFIKNINYDTKYRQCVIEFFSEKLNDIVKCKFVFLNKNIYEEIKHNYNSQSNLFYYVAESDKVYCEKISIQNEVVSTSCIPFLFISDIQNNLIIVNNENIKILDYNTYDIKFNLNKNDCLFIKNPYCVETFVDYKNGVLMFSNNTKVELNKVRQLYELKDDYCFMKEEDFYLTKINLLDNCINFIYKLGESNINYKNIESLDLIDTQNEQIVRINIRGSENYDLVLKEKLYFNLMENWISSKVKEINDLNLIYYTWSKSLRDIIIYYYFSLPSELKGSLDNLMKDGKTIESLTKNEKIKVINIMYSVLKKYKNALMEFSGYFSNELFNEHAKDNNVKFKSLFDILQKEMIYINNQINIHINNCIGNLNYLTSYIYPELDIREALEKRNKDRAIKYTATYAGLAMITGGLGFMAVAGLQGIGILDSMDRSKISDDMETAKANIFLNNSINELNTFIDNMLPKYSSDIYTMVSNFANSIKVFYTEEDIDFLKSCVYNNKLFLEMPINENVLKSKQFLVDFINQKTVIHETNFLNNSSISSNRLSRAEYHKQLKGGE